MSAGGNATIILAGAAQAETQVQEAAGNPSLQRQLAQALAAEALAKENEKVPTVEKDEASGKVKTKSGDDDAKGGQGSGRRRRKSGKKTESDEPGQSASPWSGKIVNLKI